MKYNTREQTDERKEYKHSWYLEHREQYLEKSLKYREEHAEEIKERARKWAIDNPGRVKNNNRKWKLKNKYNISEEDYYFLLEKQHGGCAICGGLPSSNKEFFCVDHDHNTGQVRGLLCDKCNRGIGHFDDEPWIILSAFNYIEEYNEV